MDWTQLVVQLPLVAAFIWYTLELAKRDGAARAARDAAWRDFMREQQAHWQAFIDAQNRVMIAGLADVTREMCEFGQRLERMSELLVRHNGMVRGLQGEDNEKSAH